MSTDWMALVAQCSPVSAVTTENGPYIARPASRIQPAHPQILIPRYVRSWSFSRVICPRVNSFLQLQAGREMSATDMM